MTESFKDISIYSQTIDFIYPDNKINFKNIQNFFQKNNLSADPNIISAMKNNYGDELTKDALKKRDLLLTFDSEKIKDYIEMNYVEGTDNTNIETIYNTINKINSDISKEDIYEFIISNNLESIKSFSKYILKIIQK